MLAIVTAPFGGMGLLLTSTVFRGVAQGASLPMGTYFYTRFFGLRAFTTIYGLQMAIVDVALGLSTPAVGLVFDLTGSYGPVFVLMIIAPLISAAIYLVLGPYRYSVNPSAPATMEKEAEQAMLPPNAAAAG